MDEKLIDRALESTRTRALTYGAKMFKSTGADLEKLKRQVEVQTCITVALNRMKKSSAVKWENRTFHCPVCNAELIEFQTYCHDCGQRMKWG